MTEVRRREANEITVGRRRYTEEEGDGSVNVSLLGMRLRIGALKWLSRWPMMGRGVHRQIRFEKQAIGGADHF